MEVLERVGTPEQKEQWLEPLLDGEIRSCFAMTEPDLASSDARNIATSAVLDGDEWVINGEKYYISGAGDPRCKIMICMVRTNPDAAPHLQQSQILVPMDTPGVEIARADARVRPRRRAPRPHAHPPHRRAGAEGQHPARRGTRASRSASCASGPGRIHHCMRSIGAAERALQLMVERGLSRKAFGKPLIALGKNTELVSRARIDIEAMRLMVLRAAKAMDLMGNAEARVWVSAVKAMVPERVCEIIDQAIQIHGATGVSQWTPLADMYTGQRTLRLADGPDEVHHMVVGRAEIARYQPALRAERTGRSPQPTRGIWRGGTCSTAGRLATPRARYFAPGVAADRDRSQTGGHEPTTSWGCSHAQQRRRSRPRPAVVAGQAPQSPQGRVLHGARVATWRVSGGATARPARIPCSPPWLAWSTTTRPTPGAAPSLRWCRR